jgi:OFA family oxalate/formate antiporter-like MFS transporter
MMLFASFYSTSLQIVMIHSTGNYFQLYMSYGMLGGLGIGMAYVTVISTINAWFPDKRGFCSGALLTGFGLSLLIIGRFANIMGRSEAIGWRSTYVAIAIALSVVLLIAAIFIKPPPPGTVFPESKAAKKARSADEIRDYTAPEMVKRPSFILIFIYITLLAASGSAAISFARDIIMDIGATEGFAVTAVGLLGIFNGVGRLTCGWLFDTLGVRKTQFISSTIAVLAPLTVVGAISMGSVFLGFLGLCLCGFSFGFAPTTTNVLAAEFYGPKNFPLNYSILNLVLIPAAFAATLAGVIKASTGGFITTFIILVACTIVGFFINLGIKKA